MKSTILYLSQKQYSLKMTMRLKLFMDNHLAQYLVFPEKFISHLQALFLFGKDNLEGFRSMALQDTSLYQFLVNNTTILDFGNMVFSMAMEDKLKLVLKNLDI